MRPRSEFGNIWEQKPPRLARPHAVASLELQVCIQSGFDVGVAENRLGRFNGLPRLAHLTWRSHDGTSATGLIQRIIAVRWNRQYLPSRIPGVRLTQRRRVCL